MVGLKETRAQDLEGLALEGTLVCPHTALPCSQKLSVCQGLRLSRRLVRSPEGKGRFP